MFLNILLLLLLINANYCLPNGSRSIDIINTNFYPKIEKVINGNYDTILCHQQITSFFNDLLNIEPWAWEVFDSWGKIPAGTQNGNIYELGNYDQCVAINHKPNSTSTINFKGQYCLININTYVTISKPLQEFFFNSLFKLKAETRDFFITKRFQFDNGFCIPNTCSPEYILELIEQIPKILDVNMTIDATINDGFCYETEDVTYTVGDIFAICFFSSIGVIMILSTSYDIYIYKRQKEEQRNSQLIAFSIYTNGKKLFACSRSKSPELIECLHGIRVLSIIWIVFGHRYSTITSVPLSNPNDAFYWVQSLFSATILSGTVAVDSFLVLGGLLVAWSMLKQLDKSKGKINIPMMYLHRYIRLTPVYAAAILFYGTLLKHFGSGPYWAIIKDDTTCHDYWWSALLYLQNYVNPLDMCLSHTWYLSMDMQIFILSPLIIYPLWKWKSKFIPILSFISLLSMACTFTIFMKYSFKASMIDETAGERMRLTYHPTHSRLGAWLVGASIGYFLHHYKEKKIVLSKSLVTICWIISVGSSFAIVFGSFPLNQIHNETTIVENAIFEAIMRVCWSICLAWIIFACVKGYGGPVNWFLSLPHWQPLSKLSYSIYILHVVVQAPLIASIKTTEYFSDINMIHQFWGDFGFTICAAIIWTLAFETPILILEKFLFSRCESKKSNEICNNNLKLETTPKKV